MRNANDTAPGATETAWPKVSVIILNWNSYEVTKDCLASLEKSDYTNFEIVLVDNGSKDGSADKLAAEFPPVRVIRNETNLGFTGGNNVGIRDALKRGTDYLLLLNNDTVVAPDCLTELIRVAESEAKIGILNPKIYFFEPPDLIWYGGGKHKTWWSFPKHLEYRKRDQNEKGPANEVSFITGCAFLIKNEVVSRIGLLDEQLFLGVEDLDLSIRAMRAGYKAIYVPAAVIWHKVSVDTEKNLGLPMRDFYYTRNSILVARKNLPARYWPLYLASIARYLAYATAVHVLKAEMPRLKALYKGVWSGCSTTILPPAVK
ncbi:MAG TPA: glycosyltransferase family 2 protein [Candidatus Angelobacter sp.]|nr:glycosyltransferase family 2 protein [Candidatus Angelobacter sp.]